MTVTRLSSQLLPTLSCCTLSHTPGLERRAGWGGVPDGSCGRAPQEGAPIIGRCPQEGALNSGAVLLHVRPPAHLGSTECSRSRLSLLLVDTHVGELRKWVTWLLSGLSWHQLVTVGVREGSGCSEGS